jgi:hypothetical protein
MSCRRTLLPGFILLALLAAPPAFAGDPPPSRVGRVSAVDGTVAVRPAGGEWSDSGVNDPVAAGMSVRTPAQGRAVLRVGAEMIALAASSELDLARLDSGATQIVLHQGRIGVRLFQFDPARSVEIDIARGGVWLLTPGDYDITAGDEHAPARVAVFDGRARLVGSGSGTAIDTTIATGSATVLSGSNPVVATLDGAAAGDFVAWWRPPGTSAADGDEVAGGEAAGGGAAGGGAKRRALRYLSPEVTGYEALDGNGGWETVEGYGAVWFPTSLPDDWAPYRYGHWRWVAPWGWNWIDDMAWGFAPSHYGRWASIPQLDPLDPADPGAARWGWVPGDRGSDPDDAPVYAPALVAFLGTAGVGLSYPDAVGPAVAWFPLAPGDIYWPGYWPGYSGDLDLIRRINEGAVADLSTIGPGVNGDPPAEIVNADYPNRRFASVVPRSVFLAGRPVAPALLRLPQQRLANAPLLAGSPQIAPAAPRAAVVVSVSRAANRLADAASRRLARTMRSLARLLRPTARTAAAATQAARAPFAQAATVRAAAVRPALLVRSTPVRTAAPALSGRSPGWNTQVARSRVVAALTSRTARPRLHLAAVHRAITR